MSPNGDMDAQCRSQLSARSYFMFMSHDHIVYRQCLIDKLELYWKLGYSGKTTLIVSSMSCRGEEKLRDN